MDKRKIVQIISTIATNANIKGFLTGKIYRGKWKHICVPGLNCYSCPGALGSCPIGSMQAVIGSIRYRFSFYVFGFMAFMALFLGRLICGWVCPFGLIQELLFKAPVPKYKIKASIDRRMRYIKYAFLFFFVLLIPMFFPNKFGISSPWFCKYICPAGTLEGGIPLLLANASLRSTIGFLFGWKAFLLLLTIVASMLIFRPFCKYVCPLGAFYALFYKVSLTQLKLDKEKCSGCKACEKTCRMGVEITQNENSPECILCGDCVKGCPHKALQIKSFLHFPLYKH